MKKKRRRKENERHTQIRLFLLRHFHRADYATGKVRLITTTKFISPHRLHSQRPIQHPMPLSRYSIRFQMFARYSLCRLAARCVHAVPTARCLSKFTDESTSRSVETPSAKAPDWATSETNGLIKQLAARIKAGGPITVAEFMRESLLNPQHVRSSSTICSEILAEEKLVLFSLPGLLHTASGVRT